MMSFDGKMLRTALVFCVGVVIVSAAVGRAPLAEKPEEFKDVDGCYIEKLHIVIPYDEAVPSPTDCFEYRCGTTEVLLISCGVAVTRPPYEIVVDKTKLYPDCCPQIQPSVKNNTIPYE